MTKNLIIGFCTRQAFRRLAPFIASLRHTTFAGDVCIIVEDVAAETVQQLRAHGILVERSGLSAPTRMTAMSSRYFNYLEVTSRCRGYDRVMLVDPTVVVFQSDPFALPLPAAIVYTREHRRIGEAQALRDAIVQAYGEGVAHNIRDCAVANSAVTIGTAPGMLRYLAAMTRELGGRTTPVTGAVDQAVHNYVVHMHPLGNALLDMDDTTAVALHTVPKDSVQVAEHGVLVNGSLTPALSHWDEQAEVRQHVNAAPHFRLDEAMRGAWPPAGHTIPPPEQRPSADAVVVFYQRQRDALWLLLFLGSLRCVNDTIAIHCVGDFDSHELTILSRYNCIVHNIPATDPDIAENVAHLYLSQALDQMAGDVATQPDQVLVLDNMRAVFPRDPFLTKTIGLSMFCEGPTRIGDSPYNSDRVGFFVSLDESWLQRPIVSSNALRGSFSNMRRFYHELLAELVGRQDLLAIQKVVQGAINKLCYGGTLGFPVIAHPNGAEVYFDYWPSGLAVDTKHGVRIGGTVPGVVLAGHPETPLMLKLRIDLSLSET